VTKKVRTTTYSILIAFVLLAVAVSTVFAAPPMDLQIEVHEVLGNGTSTAEIFSASGSAVPGVICATGTVIDLEEGAGTFGAPSSPFTIIHAQKRFTCEEKGTFDVRLVVRLDKVTGNTTASWRIISGTDDFVDLQGRGSLVGTPPGPGEIGVSIDDVYNGFVH
jgi:hypothetical protein